MSTLNRSVPPAHLNEKQLKKNTWRFESLKSFRTSLKDLQSNQDNNQLVKAGRNRMDKNSREDADW